MSDHLHLVSRTHGQNLIDVIGAIKSITTRDRWRHGGSSKAWQRSYHDEAFDRTMTYVLNSPVEAGLAASWEDYHYRIATDL